MKIFKFLSTILFLAFRNLVRQKRRNILLGFAMAFGLTILIVTFSFSAGTSDLFLNKYMAMVSGHLEFSITERAGIKGEVIRDKERYKNLLQKNINGIKYIRETVSIWARVIGIGKAEGLNISAIDKVEMDNIRGIYQVSKGSLEDFLNTENGAMLYEKKAKSLNVKIGDTLHARFKTIHGQFQAIKYTVKCILKGGNMFQEWNLFVNLNKLKRDLGLDAFETKKLQVILNDANDSVAQANKLHSLMRPKAAVIEAKLLTKKNEETILLACPKTNGNKIFEIIRGDYNPQNSLEAIVSEDLAKKLQIVVGPNLHFNYKTKYQGNRDLSLKITGIFKSDMLKGNIVLLSRQTHFKNYYDHLPRDYNDFSSLAWQSILNAQESIEQEWRLLRRSPSSQDLMVKFAELNKYKWKGQALDIRTMQEAGSQMLQFEQGLNFLVGIALVIILGIIVIGIINTLALSIQERQDESGTMRSIGISRLGLMLLFIMEYLLLALIAGFIGVIGAFLSIGLLSLPTIEATSTMSLFLYDGHLYFLIDYLAILSFWIAMIMVTAVAAFWPSYKAAKISPAQAFRKYE